MTTRIAIIGCGAVAHAHLPVVASADDAEVTVLVDKALDRAQALAADHSIAHAVADIDEIGDRADAAIVALPHHLHAPVSMALLEKGLHVLVEKPMALTMEECDRMIEAARTHDARLAVGLVSRHLAVARYVKAMIESGALGRIESFDVREGNVYSWPAASDFIYRRDTGGGVLADTGPHVLDLLLWWLGDHESFEYRDDSDGGVEAECELDLTMQSGARGFVQMSRTRELRNTWILRGDRATLEITRAFGAKFRWTLTGEEHSVEGTMSKDGEPEDPFACFHLQLADFVAAIREGREPAVSGAEGRRAVALIEACHAARNPLGSSWDVLADWMDHPAPTAAGVPGSNG